MMLDPESSETSDSTIHPANGVAATTAAAMNPQVRGELLASMAWYKYSRGIKDAL
jgi:hypothetical protein